MQDATARTAGIDPFRSRSAVRRYGFALAASAVALWLRWYLDPLVGDRSPFMTLALGYVLAAWYGGTGPGIFATILTTVGGLVLFIDPRGTIVLADPAEQLRVGTTGMLGALASWVIGSRAEALAAEREIAAELRHREAELRRMHEQLLERTRDLESFTHAVSHELRTPLRHMRAFADALLQDCGTALDDVALGHMGCITDAGERMEHLISDLLAYSHVAQGGIAGTPTRLDEAVAEALAELGPEIDRRGAQVEVDLPCSSVIAHRPTLVLVLQNLVDNGLKFVAPDRVPQLRIRSETRGSRCRISVSDNGIGISPADQPRLFSLFVRLHSQEEYPGTGIGLALVARALERMGGTAGVTSTPGVGSDFWIEIERNPHTAEEADLARTHHPPGRGQPVRRPAAAALGAPRGAQGDRPYGT